MALKGKSLHVVMVLPAPQSGEGGQSGFHPAIQGLLEGFRNSRNVRVTAVFPAIPRFRPSLPQATNLAAHPVVVPATSGLWPGQGFLTRTRFLRAALRSIRPDLVHGQGTEKEAAWVAATSGFPSVITLHGLMQEVAREPCHRWILRYRLAAWVERQAVRRADGVIALSHHARNLIQKTSRRVFEIPNAIRSEFFQIPSLPGRSSREPLVLFSGHLTPAKRPDWFIQVVQELWRQGRRFRARMLGMGDPRHPYVRGIFRMLDSTVSGRRIQLELGAKDVARHVREADILFHPSLLENQSTSVAEAMAAGRCVVAADIPGNVPLLDQGAGWLFPVQDFRAAQKSLDSVIADPRRRLSAAQAGRLKATKFQPSPVARATEEVYRTLLRRQGRRR